MIIHDWNPKHLRDEPRLRVGESAKAEWSLVPDPQYCQDKEANTPNFPICRRNYGDCLRASIAVKRHHDPGNASIAVKRHHDPGNAYKKQAFNWE